VLGLVTVENAQQGTVGVLPGRYSRRLGLHQAGRTATCRIKATKAHVVPTTRSRITRGRVMTQTQLAGTLAGCVNQQFSQIKPGGHRRISSLNFA
jgi:hypothetical protein